VKWAREQGCPWNEYTCEAAANGGHLEGLRLAREQDCPWDEETRREGTWSCCGGRGITAARGMSRRVGSQRAGTKSC